MGRRHLFVLLGFLAFVPSRVSCQEIISLQVKVSDSLFQLSQLPVRFRLTAPLVVKYEELDSRAEEILRFLENSGYPFAQVTIDSVSLGEFGVTGTLNIKPGELVMVDTLLNRTGFHLSPAVLSRLLGIRKGDTYREDALVSAVQRLRNIPYLTISRPLEVGFHKGKASIYLFPEKANSNRFDGWAGFSPDLTSKGKVAFAGALSLNLNNILGQGESWMLDWNRNQDGSQKLLLSSKTPFLAGLPFGLNARLDLLRQDTSYLNVGWEAGIPILIRASQEFNVFLRSRQSTLIKSEGMPEVPGLQPFRSLLSGISWKINRLDNLINPFKGYEVRLEVSTGRKTMEKELILGHSEFYAGFGFFKPLAQSITLLVRIQSGYLASAETFVNELSRIGGINSLRGFNEDEYRTHAYALGSLEIRYLLDTNSHLLILTDLGILAGQEKPSPEIKTPMALGLGGQIRTAGGIFRIIYALGKANGQSMDFRNSKIHLGYVGVF